MSTPWHSQWLNEPEHRFKLDLMVCCECHSNLPLNLRHYGCKDSNVEYVLSLTLFSLLPLLSSEKKWFTDEPENAYPRNIKIKPMSTHMANQVNQYKSTSSLIPPIREVEDECWTEKCLADSPYIYTLFQKRWEITHGGLMMMTMMMTGMLKTDTFLFTHSSNQGLDRNPNWKGPPMCIPLMLLTCSWTLFYLLMYP